MKKKVLIWVVAILVVLGAAYAYLTYRNRTMSPPGSASVTSGDLVVSVTYSRPSVRGRLIFGSKEQEALQPYGEYWRLGANESTEVTFSKDVLFNGQKVAAGTYRMYAFPGADQFEIGLNSETGKWGYSEPDYSKDILRTKVDVQNLPNPVEQHTIRLEDAGGTVNVIVEWADVRITIPVNPA